MHPFVRDTAMTAVIFGVAAFVWSGWAQEGPPQRWRPWLGAGSGAGLLLAALGGLLAWRNWGPESALASADARVAFGIVCGIEVALCAIGATVLALTKRPRWIATWIAFVVGVHFVPLALVFGDISMIVLAVLVVLVSAASVLLVRRGSAVLPSALVGAGTGAVFLVFSARAAAAVALA